MSKFRLNQSAKELVHELFHFDYANKVCNWEGDSQFFVDRGFPLDKLEKVQSLTPMEELFNLLSLHYKEIANENLVDKKFWILKGKSLRVDVARKMLIRFVDSNLAFFPKGITSIDLVDGFLRDNKEDDVFYYDKRDEYSKGFTDGHKSGYKECELEHGLIPEAYENNKSI